MIAVKRLQGIFWLLLVTLGALAVYMVSLRVATERNELVRVERQIVAAKGDIRYLETEFSARSSLRQLERWNAEDFRYSTPGVTQYLDGERALASLDGIQPNGPTYVAPPVMTAMVEDKGDQSAAAAQAAPASPAVSQVHGNLSMIRTASAADRVDDLPPSAQPKAVAEKAKDSDVRSNPDTKKAERMAMLDQKLLDDRTLGDLNVKAAAERHKGAR